MGCSGREPAPGGLVRPPWASPAPRVGNPRGGGRPLGLGGTPPPLEIPSPRAGAPQGPYIKRGEGGQPNPSPWRLPLPPVTPLPLAELGEALPRSPLLPPPRRRAAGSPSTSPSPLLDQEGGDVFPTVRVLHAEVPSVRRSVIGDLDHDEYDSINPVLLNASARDLQGYVDALLSLVAR